MNVEFNIGTQHSFFFVYFLYERMWYIMLHKSLDERIKLFNDYYSELDDTYKYWKFRNGGNLSKLSPWQITENILEVVCYSQLIGEFIGDLERLKSKYGTLVLMAIEENVRIDSDLVEIPDRSTMYEKVLDLFDTIIINGR